jgi:hypothetical protein
VLSLAASGWQSIRAVIHVGTIHYRDDRWIDVQLRYLRRHTREPYMVYASLDRIDRRHFSRFSLAVDHRGLAIPDKLNLVAESITERAEPDDLLVFMHGDAIPISEWVGAVRGMLVERPLAAIRRDENCGEPVPHWSFCATTPGFWTTVGGDWSRGRTWDYAGQTVSDTGGALLDVLERRGIDWHPILRTNATDLHPLWFGVYGNIVYHHGAGFRTPMSRLDSSTYVHLPVPFRNLAGVRRRIANTVLSRRMFRRISKDERFYAPLVGAGTA